MQTKKIGILTILLWLISATALAATTFVWTAPSTNEDGTPLIDLGGYKFYCGNLAGNYTVTKDIGVPVVSEYPIKNVVTAEGQWFCALTAYDTSGNESKYSNEVSFPLVVFPSPPLGLGVR